MKPTPLVMRFQPHLWAAVLHLLLFAAVLALFMGRKPGMFRSETILDQVPGFYSHVFNFSLSWLFLAGVGFLWLMMGIRMRHMALAALALIVANLAYEFLLPLLNTRDPIDALYGVVATLLAFAWMWIIHRFGLKLKGDGSNLRPFKKRGQSALLGKATLTTVFADPCFRACTAAYGAGGAIVPASKPAT